MPAPQPAQIAATAIDKSVKDEAQKVIKLRRENIQNLIFFWVIVFHSDLLLRRRISFSPPQPPPPPPPPSLPPATSREALLRPNTTDFEAQRADLHAGGYPAGNQHHTCRHARLFSDSLPSTRRRVSARVGAWLLLR